MPFICMPGCQRTGNVSSLDYRQQHSILQWSGVSKMSTRLLGDVSNKLKGTGSVMILAVGFNWRWCGPGPATTGTLPTGTWTVVAGDPS